MHQKIFISLLVVSTASLATVEVKETRSPYEVLNCLSARDRDGLAETLRYISVNNRFTPEGHTILMAAVDLYAQRLANRSMPEFGVGQPVGCVAALSGCLIGAVLPAPIQPVKKSEPVAVPEDPKPAPYAHQPQDHQHSKWNDPLGSLRKAGEDLHHTCGRFNHMMDQWDEGAIKVNLAGKVTEETAQKIKDTCGAAEQACDNVSYACNDVRLYMRSGVILSCATLAIYLGIKTVQDYLKIRRAHADYTKDIEMYETIIDELLMRQELDFSVRNNSGEAVTDFVRRLIMMHASDEVVVEHLIKVEKKILHAVRSVK